MVFDNKFIFKKTSSKIISIIMSVIFVRPSKFNSFRNEYIFLFNIFFAWI